MLWMTPPQDLVMFQERYDVRMFLKSVFQLLGIIWSFYQRNHCQGKGHSFKDGKCSNVDSEIKVQPFAHTYVYPTIPDGYYPSFAFSISVRFCAHPAKSLWLALYEKEPIVMTQTSEFLIWSLFGLSWWVPLWNYIKTQYAMMMSFKEGQPWVTKWTGSISRD